MRATVKSPLRNESAFISERVGVKETLDYIVDMSPISEGGGVDLLHVKKSFKQNVINTQQALKKTLCIKTFFL